MPQAAPVVIPRQEISCVKKILADSLARELNDRHPQVDQRQRSSPAMPALTKEGRSQ
jgi:hypothetical protein